MNIFEEDINSVEAACASDFAQLKDKNILITGGTGFVGSWLVFSFLRIAEKLNSHIFLVSRNPEKFLKQYPDLKSNLYLHFIQGDIRDFEFPRDKIEFVIHAATDVVNNQENYEEILDVNYLGTKRVLKLCQEKQVKKYLYISSGAVYGKQRPNISHLTENDFSAPDVSLAVSAYGEGKRVSEWLSCQAGRRYQFEVKRARLFAVIGPHLPLDKQFAVGNFLRDASDQKDIVIQGDGTTERSYIYASDMTIWLWTILFRGVNGEAYNVGSDQAINIYQMAQKVAEVSKKTVAVQRLQEPVIGKDPLRYIASIDKARTLGLSLNHDLKSAIARTLIFLTNKA
jgi:nucleoside-diphosphate-sugar epimerase